MKVETKEDEVQKLVDLTEVKGSKNKKWLKLEAKIEAIWTKKMMKAVILDLDLRKTKIFYVKRLEMSMVKISMVLLNLTIEVEKDVKMEI